MYHITEHQRTQNSAALIVAAVKKLIQEKDYNKITITDIQKMSTVSRATFYRLFDSIDDVISYIYDRILVETEQAIQAHHYIRWNEIALDFTRQMMDNSDIIGLIISIHREDILYASDEKFYNLVGEKMLPLDLTKRMENYYVPTLFNNMIGMLLIWIKNGKMETAEELIDILKNMFRDFNELVNRF